MARLALYYCDNCDRSWHVREEYDADLKDWFPVDDEAAVCHRCDQEAEREEVVE